MLFACGITQVFSCTEVRVTAVNGAVVIGRSMEFGVDTDSNLVIQPRGKAYTSSSPGGEPGVKWTAKYGVAYLDAFGMDIAADGMNEHGLSFGALYLPHFAEYQKVPERKGSRALAHLDLGLWILGNFSSVAEVRDALGSVYVWGKPIKRVDNIVLPLHYSVYDAEGNGMVIEYTSEGLRTFDNYLGVLTNSPTYDWHMNNVRNYVRFTAEQAPSSEINGISIAANGLGSGLLGMPGDPSPPSRLVKSAATSHFASPVADNKGAVNLAEHLMNAVDIPHGLIREGSGEKAQYDRTLWVVIKDLQARKLYFRSYDSLTLKGVDLASLDFAPTAKRLSMPIERGLPAYIDVTDRLN